MTGDRASCPVCLTSQSVTASGALRSHPKGRPPCAGSGTMVHSEPPPVVTRPTRRPPSPPPVVTRRIPPPPPREPEPEPEPEPRTPPVSLGKGTYASGEPMLDPRATPVPPGHVVVTLVAYVPADGPAADQAALLFEDPTALYRALDAAPNEHVRLTLRAAP